MADMGDADQAELQRLVAAEQQKAQFTAQVRGQGPGWRDDRVNTGPAELRTLVSQVALGPC